MFLSLRYSSRLPLKGFHPKNSRYLQSSLVKKLHKRLEREGGGIRGGRNGRNVVERFGKGFDKDSQRIWGGRKDDRLPASIEAAIEVVCQPVDSFLSLPFVYSASRLTPFCRAFHPARPSGPTEGLPPSPCFSSRLFLPSSHAPLKIFLSL